MIRKLKKYTVKMSYEPLSTVDTDQTPKENLLSEKSKKKYQTLYKIYYQEKYSSEHFTVGVFADEKEADKVFQQTIENAEKNCKQESDRMERKDRILNRIYYRDRTYDYAIISLENYYTTTKVNLIGHRRIFYIEFAVYECNIYKTKMEIPLGQFNRVQIKTQN